MSKPLISIIIPTRNRQQYACAAVKNILSFNSDLQVIVQDNSDDESLRELLNHEIHDSKIIYHYKKEKIAGVDNYNIAAHYATGEYFCAIGDDDTVLPHIVDCAKWMKKNNIDAVLPSKSLYYFWPSNDKAKHSAYLGIGDFSGYVQVCDPKEGVIALLRQGGQDYLTLSMVGSYHGLVKMSRMCEVKEITGRFYGGLSPDMYSAICLSLLPDMRFVKMDYPITLPGICNASTSAASDAGQHIGLLNTAPHFDGLLEPYTWDSIVPEVYSVQTIWCETMIHALRKMRRDDLIAKYFDKGQLINRLINDNKGHKEFLMQFLTEQDKLLLNEEITSKKKNRITSIIKYVFSVVMGRSKRIYNCNDIAQATQEVEKHLSKKYYAKAWERICSDIS